MGIQFDTDKQCFNFDFGQDGEKDIICLKENGYQVEAFGECFYYGYEFADNADSTVRTKFIQRLKFPSDLQKDNEITAFIQKAVNDLSKKIDLYDYDLVIMPQSSSLVNQYTSRYIYRFSQPMLRSIELVKALPADIRFDYDAYKRHYLDDILENGRPRYTETQKEQTLKAIEEMMANIHQKDYFTIAKDVKKSKMRPYIMGFLKFATDEEEELYKSIKYRNILILDDITTSGSTLNEILRTLRILNEDNSITIFSLIGRKDLMAESV